MSYSILLLAASYAAAGPNGTTGPGMAAQPRGGRVVYTQPSRGASGGLVKLADWLRGERGSATPSRSPYHPTVRSGYVIRQSAEPPLAAAGPAVATTSAKVSAEEPAPAPAADAAQADAPQEKVLRVAIADDRSWVLGELQHVHTGGGDIWLVRYAPLDTDDPLGGAVRLAPGLDMSKFQEGDFVFVRGRLLSEQRTSRRVGAPLYQADVIELNERVGE